MRQRVVIVENGRDGTVRYAGTAGTIDGYWEFGGGDVITIVSMGSREEWAQSYAWAVDSRAAILRFVADETIRQRAPTCVADIDEDRGVILLRVAPGTAVPVGPPPGGTPQAKAAAFVRRQSDLKANLALILLAIFSIGGAVMWFGKKALSVAPAHGVPLGECLRYDAPSPGGISCLVQKTDPHLPNWSGRGGGETTSVSLLNIPLDGSAPRLVAVASGLAQNSYSLARIMGSDGRTLWFDVAGLYGVRLDDGALVSPKEFQLANPNLDPNWWDDQRNMDVVDGRLHVMRPDRSAALDVDPATLNATPVTPKPSNARFLRRDVEDYLIEAALTETTYRKPAYLRLDASSKALRLAGPSGVLMVHTSQGGLAGTLLVSRMDDAGREIWTTDTGLDRFALQQILPGRDVMAFIGKRPPVPDKLSEPVAVLLDTATGNVATHSLWR